MSRANSATADAYLTPVTRRYLESFADGFQGGLSAFGNKLLFMQSDGGLCAWDHFSGLRAILSGPAGGVIGFSRTCFDADEGTPLIGCDIGGTRYVPVGNLTDVIVPMSHVTVVNWSMSLRPR